jgi:hypothetical protein
MKHFPEAIPTLYYDRTRQIVSRERSSLKYAEVLLQEDEIAGRKTGVET